MKLLWHVGVVDPLRLLLQTLPLYALEEEGGGGSRRGGEGGGMEGMGVCWGRGVIPFTFL